MSPPRWCLVLHGKVASDDAVRASVAHLRERGVRLDVRVTWERGDAGRFVDEAVAAGADALIAGGGDGTLGELASALAERDAPADALPALGVMPLGTANDFAVSARIPQAPVPALELVEDGAARPVDMLRVETDDETRWCVNLASGGFGAEVTVETDDNLKQMLGGLAYLITGIARLGRIEPIEASLRGPEFEWDGNLIALGIGNGRQAGGGQHLCPDAVLDDGLCDLTVVPELSGELAAAAGALVRGGQRAALERAALRTRLPWVELRTPVPFVLNLDGEPMRARRFRVECVPGRLRMYLPADTPLCRTAAGAARTPPVGLQ